MARWTKDTAIEQLKSLLSAAGRLSAMRRFSAEHTRWLVQTLRVLEEVFGASSRYYLTIAGIPWRETSSFIVSGWNPDRAVEQRHQEAYVNQLDIARGVLQAALDELEASTIDDVYKGKDTPRESSGIVKVLNLVEHKLRKVIRETPGKEHEVQDALENLLIGADVSYSREAESIEYSAKTYVPDFSLHRLDLVVEVKLSARNGRDKEIIAEINDDILAYKTKYGNLLFVIYDMGFIRDVDRFCEKFEETEGVLIRIVKH